LTRAECKFEPVPLNTTSSWIDPEYEALLCTSSGLANGMVTTPIGQLHGWTATNLVSFAIAGLVLPLSLTPDHLWNGRHIFGTETQFPATEASRGTKISENFKR